MSVSDATHPDDFTLASFALGRLSDDDSLPIEEHIAHCDSCRERLEATPADSLVTRVQAVGSARPEPSAGRAAAGYELRDEIGRGGMGIVYRARQIGLNRVVALKMLRDGLSANPGDRARFRAEAGAVSRLRHPNIVQIYEVGERDGQPFLALEYINGGPLNLRLAGQPLTPAHAASLIEILARAVHYAHSQGVVHRDLKPANVLLQFADSDPSINRPDFESAVLKITDFGLAKFVDSSDGPTQTGEILGTPSYMAPEQAGGRANSVGPATDVYALGAMLYECLTGRPPFRAATALETLDQVRNEEPVSARLLQPRIPRDLNTITLKCLRKEPAQRYATSEDLADDLRRWQAGEPIRARPTGAGERLLKWMHRRPAAAALVVVLVTGAALAFAGALVHTARLGDEIARTEDQKQRAVAHYREARDTLRRLLDRGEPSKWSPTTHPSDIYLSQIEEALSFYRAALGADPSDVEMARDMARAHLTAATAQSLRGKVDRATANLAAARALLEPLYAEHPDDLLTGRHLALCYNALALIESRPDAAIALRRKALALRERLMETDVGDPTRTRALPEAVHNLGASLQSAGRLPEAEPHYRRAMELWREIRRTDPDVYSAMSLAESQINLAVLLQQFPNRVDEVFALYRGADELLLPLVDDPARGVDVTTSLAIAYLNWSNMYSASSRISEAVDMLARAITLLDKALVREPKWIAARETRAKVYGARAILLQNRGEFRRALDDWNRAAADALSDDLRKTVQMARAMLSSRLGDHPAAAASATELAARSDLTGDDRYNVACAFALCIPPVLADQSLDTVERTRRADGYAQQALQLLKSARDAGFFRDPQAVSHLHKDSDLEPLRSRPGWREFERSLSH